RRERVVVVRVGRGRLQHLAHGQRRRPRREREDRPGVRHGLAADEVGDEPGLARRDPHELGRGGHHRAVGRLRHHRILEVRSEPAWPRYVRVGANSPSLWPTMLSLMNTGTCRRPSWTAIVWPTISGKTVDVRDQVRIIRFSLASFIAAMRCMSRASTNGPFFRLLPTYRSPECFPRLRPRTISRWLAFFLFRVR